MVAVDSEKRAPRCSFQHTVAITGNRATREHTHTWSTSLAIMASNGFYMFCNSCQCLETFETVPNGSKRFKTAKNMFTC